MSMRGGLFSNCLALAFYAIASCASVSQVPEPVATNQTVVPQSMRYTGVAQDRAGDAVEAVFRVYASQEGGEALWSETRHVTIGSDGNYSVLLGAATQGGLPQTVFADGQARWLGVSLERGPEEPRVLLVSVPYAMKAADAETLAGVPAAEFVTQAQLNKGIADAAGEVTPDRPAGKVRPETTPTGSGTANTIPLWATSSTLGNSALTQSGKNITAAGSISAQSNATASLSAAVAGTENATTGEVAGVAGTAISNAGAGVAGFENAKTGQVYGVFGDTSSTTANAAGIYGHEEATMGEVFGVLGGTPSGTDGDSGVHGNEGSKTGKVFGVSGGTSSSTDGAAGVNGNEGSSTGWVHGVVGGTISSTTGASGVFGNEGSATGQVYGVTGNTASVTANAAGVYGTESAAMGQVYGVIGTTASETTDAGGVFGANNATKGLVAGVYGNAYSPTTNAAGVSGWEGAQTGEVWGVTGVTFSTGPNAAGVNGYEGASDSLVAGVRGSTESIGTGAAGVFGQEIAKTGQVYGVSGNTNSATQGAAGVYGYEGAATGSVAGVVGDTASANGEGVYGSATATAGSAVGVIGVTSSSGGAGGKFINRSGSGLVLQGLSGSSFKSVFTVDASGNGVFAGNLDVTGKLTKGSGSFKIDHPLDPAHKYLSHSFVESPDMMNVYNGNITTDKHGWATVILPDYFEALNRDFRYQLTVIGQFAQAIVDKEIAGNRFVIRTSKPGVKVSWQVTGIRQDAYANADRIPVEEDKPAAEQGYYLHPEAFGQPAYKSITALEEQARGQKAGDPGSR